MKKLATYYRRLEITRIINYLGVFLLVLAFISLIIAFALHRNSSIDFWRGFFTNAGTELFSIAITVLIINVLYQKSESERFKKQLIREMRSPDNGIALRAISELAAYGWLFDGSLSGEHLGGANLEGANLLNAHLEKVELWNSNLANARLRGAILRNSNLSRSNLQGARLIEADLESAVLSEANLFGAQLNDANLRNTILRGTDFSHSDLRGTDLRGAEINSAIFIDTKYSHRTLWPSGFNPDWIYFSDD